MAVEVETELWGVETSKAVENFPVSGDPVPAPVVRWLGRLKAAAAPGSASRVQLSIIPIPQLVQMRRRRSGRPAGSSPGCPHREQKWIGFGRPPSWGVSDRSIRIRAVTRR